MSKDIQATPNAVSNDHCKLSSYMFKYQRTYILQQYRNTIWDQNAIRERVNDTGLTSCAGIHDDDDNYHSNCWGGWHSLMDGNKKNWVTYILQEHRGNCNEINNIPDEKQST